MSDNFNQGPVYRAHTPNEAGAWHSLQEHLLQVARIAAGFARRFEAEDLAYLAGLIHDLGKYSPEFQRYLRECHRAEQGLGPRPPRGSAPHKQAGAAFAAECGLHLLVPLILGHHSGMPGGALAKGEVLQFAGNRLQSLCTVAASEFPELKSPPDLKPLVRRLAPTAYDCELLIRMLFSCLVDADALDTEAHFQPADAGRRQRALPSIAELRGRFRENQAALLARVEPSRLNDLRREVYEASLQAAIALPGIFKLTVPTGGGKTRSSLAFALEHACRHGLERIIYAIPYTSIVDQTAAEFEQILGADAVLEHHSALEPDEECPEREMWRRLASQNWDAPLVVTTTVQLFESLFGHRPARCRKVHRLVRSVIVLDEVQTLPVKLLAPIVDGLRRLSERYGTTVLLCTATQPALDQESLEQIGFPGVREIAPDPVRLFTELRRVEYDLEPLAAEEGWTWDDVASEMRREPTCLAIVNTRRDAIALLDALGDERALHLSTLLCGRHRRQTLAAIRRRLKEGEPCRVVSTQVVEAGVDLDFPWVLRAVGPLDRIVQAAGRCNREGRLPGPGRVTIFRPADGGFPGGSYRVALDVAARYLNQGQDLHDPAVYRQYFREVYAQDTLDARSIQRLRKELDFPEVAERMRLIDATRSVFVRYPPCQDEVEALLSQARSCRNGLPRELWRKVQPFLVSLHDYQFRQFEQQGLIELVAPDFWLWRGGYDETRGITSAAIDPSDLIA